jgi:hypothetical protein
MEAPCRENLTYFGEMASDGDDGAVIIEILRCAQHDLLSKSTTPLKPKKA